MCPLRLVLIFLSATLAGFFVLRGLKSQPELDFAVDLQGDDEEEVAVSEKVRSAICTGFWTCVDMASGRYLWKNLVSSPAAAAGSEESKKSS